MFSTLIGNSHIKTYLKKIVDRESFGNSYLFSGPEGIGKGHFAEEFAAMLLCSKDPHGINKHKLETGNHPDLCIFRPEGKIAMHSMDTMRRLGDEVFQAPYEAPYKVFLVHDAHRMLPYSANALLKTFEEPLPTSIIILISHAPELLLPTILSRCQTLHFHHIPEEEIAAFLMEHKQCSAEKAAHIAGLAHGSLGQAVALLEEGGVFRERILNILSKGKFTSYFELLEVVKELSDKLEKDKSALEKAARTDIIGKIATKDLPAAQQQLLEKEIEGAVASRFSEQIYNLFDIILSWYRDMHLLYIGGDARHLIHRDQQSILQHLAMKQEPLPIEEVIQAIKDARLSHARSTSLAICLENLFLKLKTI